MSSRKQISIVLHRVPAPPVFAVAARGGATNAGEDDHDERNRCGDHELGRPARFDGHASAESERPEMINRSLALQFIIT